jgi:hypothetical protein
MATNPTPLELDRWLVIRQPNGASVIVLVVDDTDDDDLAHAVAREDMVASENFGGVWGAGQREGNVVVGFALIQLGGGLERQWYTDNIHRELLEAILDVPHTVAIMPREIAGGAKTPREVASRFGGSLLVEVEHRSPQVEQTLRDRGDP